MMRVEFLPARRLTMPPAFGVRFDSMDERDPAAGKSGLLRASS